MNTEQQQKLDKSAWPDGPWKAEPDRVQWVHADLDCLMRRTKHGIWCGYVGVPAGNPAYEKDYDSDLLANIEVHGGLTYADRCNGVICHVPEAGRPDDVWWLGFDCCHGWDYAPGIESLLPFPDLGGPDATNEYRDLAYVEGQVNSLAEQLARMTEKVS